MGNINLHNASKNKNDEFYTQLPDIEREINHYREHLKGKVIFCNCDDPELSNFWKFFHLNFEKLGIKKLISTHFVYEDIFKQGETYKLEYEGGNDSDIMVGVKTILNENGDFRSKECVEILEKSDVVITNPPFSLFREYVGQLMEYKKKFVIIGNKNAITYKEVFKLIKENKLWVGNTPMGIDLLFDVPQHFAKKLITNKKEGSGYKIVNGVVKGRSQSIWFTNLDHKKRHENLILYKTYNKKDYPKYDNYKAINVDVTKEIPVDYDGVMGVPITFLDKYNPEQFEIIGLANDKREKDEAFIQATPYYLDEQHKNFVGFVLNGKATYARILIKKRKIK
jgi:hypothetical protein